MLDVLIRGGWVADGAGSPPFLGDVAIEGGKIADVGRLGAAATADRVIDATGKIVCPGFVDPHSHSDFSILANPTAESTIRQGVTTEVVGNCGWSYAPVTPGLRAGHPQPAARVRLRQADDPVVDLRRAPRVPLGRRPHAQFRLVRRPQRDPARRGRVRLDAERRAAGDDGGLRPRGDAVGRARHVDRARVQPRPGGDDRRADAPERRRRGVRRHLHEPRPQPRLGPARGDRRVPRGRAGGRHEGRDLAPERPPQHERARAGLGARGREDGGEPRDRARRPRRHDAVPGGPRPDGRDPAAVGRRGRAGGGGGEAARPGAPRADAQRERPLLALHPQGRVGARVLPGDSRSTPSSAGSTSARSRSGSARTPGTATSTSSPTRARTTRRSSRSGRSSPTSTWRR